MAQFSNTGTPAGLRVKRYQAETRTSHASQHHEHRNAATPRLWRSSSLSSEDSVSVSRALYCTYPVPLHAHTHFLATVRPALVLHRVGGQTLAAPLLLAGLRFAQDLRHALLMDGVQTLMDKRRRGNGGGGYLIKPVFSGNTQGSEWNQGGGFTSEPPVSCQTVWGIHYSGEGKSPSNSRVGAGESLP